jgi:hypothetical protein
MAHIGDAKTRAAAGPKTLELRRGFQSSMGMTRPVAQNAEAGWSLDLGSLETSTAARIIQNALALSHLAGPGQEI